jgi:hypothetical protein
MTLCNTDTGTSFEPIGDGLTGMGFQTLAIGEPRSIPKHCQHHEIWLNYHRPLVGQKPLLG